MSEETKSDKGEKNEETKEQEKLNPTVKIEEAGPCKKKLDVELSAEKVKAEIDKTFKELLDEMAVPGFRKGRVPRSIAERRFGSRVNDEVKNDLIAKSLAEVIEEQKMETIGEPKIDDVVFEEGKPLTYVAVVIMQPEVKFEGYKGISLNRKVEPVTDKEVDERIDFLRHRAATHAPVERGIKAGDIVTTDFSLKCGDKTLRDVKDAQFIIDGESFFGLKVGSLEKLFAKKKTGEGLSLTVTLPERFREEEYRGKEAALDITVKEVKEEQMPEADDEWAKKLDYDDVAELREELKKEAQKHHELLSEVDLRNQVRAFLVEKAEFDLPEELVKDQVEAYFRRKRLEMEDHGLDPGLIEKEIEELRKTENKAEENARKMLKGYFILRSIAEREKVFVTEDEIAKQLAVIAAQYGRSTEDMAGLYEETGLISELRTDMREKKTIDFIIKNAEIKEA